jgi:hypothetical protein
LPAAARRTDVVVMKRCRPAGQGLLVKAPRDRPSGLAAALGIRWAAMQVGQRAAGCAAQNFCCFLVGELPQHGTGVCLRLDWLPPLS